MDARTGGLISGLFTVLMSFPFGLISGGGISWRLRFGIGLGEVIKSASSPGGCVGITELKLDPCAASSCLVGDGREIGSMADCDSVKDERPLSPERGKEDSQQLDSSSMTEAG